MTKKIVTYIKAIFKAVIKKSKESQIANIPAQMMPHAKCFIYDHPQCLRLLVESITAEESTPTIIITGTVYIVTARPTKK
ncbi:hypothetical protein K0H71_13110 [Bacillus sp. IITD106]|nr:hypothetical protein [Bacillus sp. IITD106]